MTIQLQGFFSVFFAICVFILDVFFAKLHVKGANAVPKQLSPMSNTSEVPGSNINTKQGKKSKKFVANLMRKFQTPCLGQGEAEATPTFEWTAVLISRCTLFKRMPDGKGFSTFRGTFLFRLLRKIESAAVHSFLPTEQWEAPSSSGAREVGEVQTPTPWLRDGGPGFFFRPMSF